MKGNRDVVPLVEIVVLLLMMMIFSRPSSFCDAGRPLRPETTTDQGKEATMIGMMSNSNIINKEAAVFSHLMGVESDDDDDNEEEEGCGEEGNDDKEEECRMKRRMLGEAHLDYIYTQRHNRP